MAYPKHPWEEVDSFTCVIIQRGFKPFMSRKKILSYPNILKPDRVSYRIFSLGGGDVCGLSGMGEYFSQVTPRNGAKSIVVSFC